MSIINNSDIDISLLNNDIFIEACKNDNIELLKKIYPLKDWIFDIEDENDVYKEENALCFCCRFGYLEAVKFLCSTNTIDVHELNEEAFCLACQENHIDIAKFLFQEYPDIDIMDFFCKSFFSACCEGNLEIAKWLTNIEPKIINTEWISSTFLSACSKGHINIAKFIFDSTEEKHRNKFVENVLGEVCENKQLEVLKWLLEIDKKVSTSKYFVKFTFLSSCQKGNIEMVKYLISIYSKSIILNVLYMDQINIAFIFACSNNDWEIAEYIKNSYPQIDFLDKDECYYSSNCFESACQNGNIEIAKRLYNLNPELDRNSNFSFNFSNLCMTGDLESVKWYINQNPNNEIDDNILSEIIVSVEDKHIEILNWLITFKPDLIDETEIDNFFLEALDKNHIGAINFFSKLKKNYNHEDIQNIFQKCCYSLDTVLIEWFFDNFSTINNIDKDFIDELINCGYLKVVRWLYNKFNDIEITFKAFDIYSSKCYKVSEILDFYNWLYELNPNVELSSDDFEDYIVGYTEENNLKIIKWFFSKFENYKSTLDFNNIFYCACSNGSIDVVKFLKNNFKIDDDILKKSFLKAAESEYLRVISWLFNSDERKDFYKNIDLKIRHNNIINWATYPNYNQIRMLNWFVSNGFFNKELTKSFFSVLCHYDKQDMLYYIDNNKLEMDLEIYELGMTICCHSNDDCFLKELIKREPRLKSEKSIIQAINTNYLKIIEIFINKENINDLSIQEIFTNFYKFENQNQEVLNYFTNTKPMNQSV